MERKPADFEFIKKIWENNTDPTMLYIHSPYCKKICSYCVHHGTLKDDFYDEYFDKYLPSQIEKYLPIIRKQDIQVIYFGGGTPNYDLRKLTPTLELIKDIPYTEKLIELHGNIKITDEDINFIASHGFSTVILCFQTFNKKILNSYNRYCDEDNNIKEIVEKFHNKGIYVGSDLIQFLKSEEEYEQCVKDYEYLVSCGVDEITILPEHHLRDGAPNRAKDIIQELSKRKDGFKTFSTDILNDVTAPNGFDYYNYKFHCFRRVREKTVQEGRFIFVPYLNEMGTKGMNIATLGIGAYKHQFRDIYSFTRQYEYLEKFDNGKPAYELVKYMSFYDKIIAWAKFFKDSGIEPPPGTNFSFTNDCQRVGKGFKEGEEFYTPMDTFEDKMCIFNINSTPKFVNEFKDWLAENNINDDYDEILKWLEK